MPWEEVPVNQPGGGWEEVPVSSTPSQNASRQSSKGLVDTLWERAKAYSESKRPKTLKEALLKGIGNAGLGMPSVGDIPFFPNQSVAGVVKGALDLPVGLAQSASHLTGIDTKNVDAGVDAYSDFFKNNFDKSTAGEITGQGVLNLIPGTGYAATVGKSLLPAVATPETGLKNGSDYASRKSLEAGVGLALGAGIPAVGKLTRAASSGVNRLKSKLANAPSVAELQGELESGFGGLKAGDYLKKKAIEKYEAPLAAHDAIMNEVAQEAPAVTTQYKNTLSALNKIVDDYNNNVSQMRPEQIEQILELKGRIEKAVAPSSGQVLDSVGAYLNNSQPLSEGAGSSVSNDLAGLIRAYQDFGKPLGKNMAGHGDRLSRGTLQDIRYAMLQDAYDSAPELSGKWADAREVFRNQVVPLFSKQEGGDILTKIRDSATPNDLLQQLVQSGFRDMKVDRAGIIKKGADAAPFIWQAIENANQQANGRPGGFSQALNKAMPGLEAVATPDMTNRLKNMITAARTSQVAGHAADTGLAAAAAGFGHLIGLPVIGDVVAGGIGLGSKFMPALSGQGRAWSVVQNPQVRSFLAKAWNLPVNSPEFDSKLAQYLSLQVGEAQQP